MKSTLTNVSRNKISTILENSSHSRDIVKLYSDINALRNSFLGEKDLLEFEGIKLTKTLKGMIQNTKDPLLVDTQMQLLNKLNTFLSQCTAVNALFFERNHTHSNILINLEEIEELIGLELIEQTLKGKDAAFIEQLLMLVVGYKESLFQIDKLFFDQAKVRYVLDQTQKRDLLITHIQELILRLQTITASIPDIARKGRNIILEMQQYEKNVLAYFVEFGILEINSRELNVFQNQLLKQMDTMDTTFSESIQQLSSKMLNVTLLSIFVTLFFTTVIVVSLGVVIMFFFRSMNKEIKERKQTEKELSEKTAFLDKIIESAALSTWIADENGTAIRANPACLELLGEAENDVIGRYNIFEDELIEKNGFMPEIRELYENGKPANIVMDYRVASGGDGDDKKATHKTVNSIMTPIKDGAGKVSNVIVQTIDLTEIKRMEKELIQSSKMESIGVLAGGIAHEFNNILSIIIGNNELVMQELPEWGYARESSEEIRIAGMRARDVVKQLLTFSRQDNAKKRPMDIGAVVDQTMKLIRSSTPTNIDIHLTIAEDLAPVIGNPTQINQVFINLCANASGAMLNAGGAIHVDLCNEAVEESPSVYPVKLIPGRYVKIFVRDTGHGMDKHVLDRIFEPYFTTKEVGEGSGIGLAVVHGIVEKHNGAIFAESKLDQGTTFTLMFPAYDGQLEKQEGKQPQLPEGNERILLVDDESAILKLGKKQLEYLGYEVHGTTDAENALVMFKSGPDTFDLVITDMAMPKMTGDQLISEIRKIRSGIPTILCTGYSHKISEEKAYQMGINAFIMKPLDKVNFAVSVRRVLDEFIKNPAK